MPWGRWVADEAQGATEALNRMQLDANSTGSLFKARADNLSQQIETLGAYTMTSATAPNFSGSVTGNMSANAWIMALSNPLVFTPPNRRIRSCTVFCNFRSTASVGGVGTPPMMKLNGNTFTDWMHEVARPGPVFNEGWYSVVGTVPLAPGQSLTVQYGLRMDPFSNATFTVTNATIWLAYFGGL